MSIKASIVTTLIMNALRAGAKPNVVEFLGDLYERTLDIDRNFKNMNPTIVKAEVEKIEARLKRAKIYKKETPFTLRERLLVCREELEAAFKQISKAKRPA